MSKEKYVAYVDLMLKVLPYVANEKCFNLKGGTAINLFVRNMPRMSVDIDLAYVGKESRDRAIKNAEAALKKSKLKSKNIFLWQKSCGQLNQIQITSEN